MNVCVAFWMDVGVDTLRGSVVTIDTLDVADRVTNVVES